jgi:hypothetical protein
MTRTIVDLPRPMIEADAPARRQLGPGVVDDGASAGRTVIPVRLSMGRA